MIGTFPNPWPSAAEKYAAIISHLRYWSPDTDDFQKVVNQCDASKTLEFIKVEDLGSFLVSLAFSYTKDKGYKRRADKSISRVDLISHGDSSRLAFRGKIDIPGKITWLGGSPPEDGEEVKYGFLDKTAIDVINAVREDISVAYSKTAKQVSFNDCLKCFTADAKIVFYLCHSAGTGSGFRTNILKRTATMLGISACGFTNLIKYTYEQGKGYLLTLVEMVKEGKEYKEREIVPRTRNYRDLDASDRFMCVAPAKSQKPPAQTPKPAQK